MRTNAAIIKLREDEDLLYLQGSQKICQRRNHYSDKGEVFWGYFLGQVIIPKSVSGSDATHASIQSNV